MYSTNIQPKSEIRGSLLLINSKPLGQGFISCKLLVHLSQLNCSIKHYMCSNMLIQRTSVDCYIRIIYSNQCNQGSHTCTELSCPSHRHKNYNSWLCEKINEYFKRTLTHVVIPRRSSQSVTVLCSLLSHLRSLWLLSRSSNSTKRFNPPLIPSTLPTTTLPYV